MNHQSPLFVTVTRWLARGLSIPILLFWGWFLIAHLLGNAGASSRPLVWNDYAILASLITALAGLALALKREFTGAIITLVAITVCAMLNWRVLIFPGTLILVTALLYLFAWWMDRTPRRTAARPHPAG